LFIEDIPYHLRNSVEYLDLPIYIDLSAEECQPPPDLALGDTLMVMGLIRNQGRPVKLLFNPGPSRELVESHPLVRELAPATEPSPRLNLKTLPVSRSGRAQSWTSDTLHRLWLPVLPVDRVCANPVLAHSLYYKLSTKDDRPSLFLDPARPPALADLLSRNRPNLVLYPLNPGRRDYLWQDEAWWLGLLKRVGQDFNVVAVGAQDYGGIGQAVDAALPMDDPSSTLWDLAWLISQADAFAGRDGGLSHLALAVNDRVAVVWDSMASYRFWACRAAHNLIFSNPYTHRYPQTCRLSLKDLPGQVKSVRVTDAHGQIREETLPEEGFEQRVKELFGSVENFASMILARRELEQDRGGVEGWISDPQQKKDLYSLSWGFTHKALSGGLPPGVNWVAPVFP
jgi:hypothetical protein